MTKKWNEPKGKSIDGMSTERHMELLEQQRVIQKSSKYSKKDYIIIASTLKGLPLEKRKKEFRKYNKLFKSDNPRYDSKKFKQACDL